MKKFIAALFITFILLPGCGKIREKTTEKINEKIENTLDENMRIVDSLTENSMKNIDSISKRTGIPVDTLKARLDSMNRITKEALKRNVK